MLKKIVSRRDVLAAMGTVGGGFGVAAKGLPQKSASEPTPRLQVCVFSKHFQWTDWKETGELAAEIGFDGVDLTVRSGGHVLPERVEQDLPKAVEAIRGSGVSVPMITAGIVDTKSPHAEAILRSAGGLGIRYYRWGGLRYSYDRDIAEQLDELRPRVRALAELNEKHKICAMYHTHSGLGQVGASIWDLWVLLKDMDPRWVGVNYDLGHAIVEGGYGGWLNSVHLVRKHLRGVALKDFRWGKNAQGEWRPQWCAPGEGMVNFARFFQILKAAGFAGPVQLHFEYPGLGGADAGKTALGIPKPQLLAIMRRDLNYVRKLMREAQLL